jgi:anti-sigma regulatory factor (Ser/Thr protein kinase)
MCIRIEQDVPKGPFASQQARDFVGRQLNSILGSSPRAEVTDDARLIASELVTNAVRAGSPAVHLVLEVHHGTVTLEVHDDVPDPPVLRRPGPGANTGRGLLIVDALAEAWGAEPSTDGKVVWARLAVPPALTRSVGCERAALA